MCVRERERENTLLDNALLHKDEDLSTSGLFILFFIFFSLFFFFNNSVPDDKHSNTKRERRTDRQRDRQDKETDRDRVRIKKKDAKETCHKHYPPDE